MAIKRGSKVDMNSSSASMTDLMFLLLIFLMIATTLIDPNALKLMLPRSNSNNKEKPITTVSITTDLQYYIETTQVPFEELESGLKSRLTGVEEPTISLHCDENLAIKEMVKVMNIAKRNDYKLVLATNPE